MSLLKDSDSVGLVAAAGASSRMGFPKALLSPRGGVPVALTLAATMKATGIRRVFCTLPPPSAVPLGHQPAMAALAERLKAAGVQVLSNAEWDAGLLGSVRSVLAEAPGTEALFMTPVDAPGCTTELVEALWQAHAATPRLPLFPRVDGKAGHPVLLPAVLFPRLWAFRGEGGVRQALALADAPGVTWHDARACANLDTLEQAEAWNPSLACWSP